MDSSLAMTAGYIVGSVLLVLLFMVCLWKGCRPKKEYHQANVVPQQEPVNQSMFYDEDLGTLLLLAVGRGGGGGSSSMC